MASIIAQASADIMVVADRVVEIDKFFDTVEPALNFDNKVLEQICKDHAKNVYNVSRRINELKSLEELIGVKQAAAESRLWRKYNESHSRALTAKDIQAYLQGEPEIVVFRELLVELTYVKKQGESIYEALKDMGWQIKYVTDLRIHELQEVVV